MKLFAIALLLICSCTADGQLTKEKIARMDSFMRSIDTARQAMGSVALAKNGKILYNRTIGFASVSDVGNVKANNNTKYRIGSISKMFTAVMVLQLAEEKKLKLDAPLSDFFPKIPNAKKITISQMLNHHSGIHNFTDDEDYSTYNTRPHSRQQLLDKFYAADPDFEPGTKGQYSNTNYVLLGFIIEDITKNTYCNELAKRITAKIDLKSTHCFGTTDVAKNEAHSYYLFNDEWTQRSETDVTIPGGAGALISTSADLTKFISALFTNKLISKESLAIMTSVKDDYGSGMFKFPFFELANYGHTGGIDGFSSILSYFPHDSVSLAICVNGGNFSFNDIGIGILSIYYDKPYTIPDFKTVELDPATLPLYEGVFSSKDFPLKITIKKDGNYLTAQATGQGAFPLEAKSETEFEFNEADIKIKFIKGGTGSYDSFKFSQGGARFTFEKEK